MERIFRFPIKVGKESIDVLGHTNNKEYLRWMEEAALAHSDSLGWTMGRYLKIGKVFVASTHKIEYLRPTFEGDELTMLTWVETMDGSKSRRCFYLKRDNKVCMQGWTEWTFVDLQTGRAANISGEVKMICRLCRRTIRSSKHQAFEEVLRSHDPGKFGRLRPPLLFLCMKTVTISLPRE